MKKRIFTLMLAVLLIIMSLAGCGGSQKAGTDGESGAKQMDYLQIYSGLLDTYYKVIKTPDNYDESVEGRAGVIEAARHLGDTALSTIGYLIEDINEDDIPELLIGVSNKDEGAYTANDIYALYTIKDQEPHFVLEGRSRNTYSLMKGGKIFNCGSNGAIYRIFGCYELDKNSELACQDFYFSYEKNNDYEDIGFYYNTTGVYEKEEAKELKIDAGEFASKEEEFAEKTIEIDFTSFEEYEPADEGEPAEEPEEQVSTKNPEFCGSWRCEYQGTDGNRWVLCIEMTEEGTAVYKCGPPQSEFMVDCRGTWKLNEENHIILDLVDEYEGFPFVGEYNWEITDGALSIYSIIGDAFIYDTEGKTFVFYKS